MRMIDPIEQYVVERKFYVVGDDKVANGQRQVKEKMIEFVDRVSKIAADLVNGDNTVESVNISYPDTDTYPAHFSVQYDCTVRLL